MATSQNGYQVYVSSSPLKALPWITGRVKPGDVYDVFDHLCRRFDKEVENIRRDCSWGWAYRSIRGRSSGYSNHASATAIDLNAPDHPLGKANTFSRSQQQTIRALLDELDGVVRWGGDYRSRKDDMHFEIDAEHAAVARVAAKLRGGGSAEKLVAVWCPDPKIPISLNEIVGQLLIAVGAEDGKISRSNSVGRLQQALNEVYDAGLVVDGYAGPATISAWEKHEAPAVSGRPRVPDATNLRRLQERFEVVA